MALPSTIAAPAGDNVSEIQSLASRAQELERSLNDLNSWYVGLVFLTVLLAAAVFLVQFLVIRKSRELAQTQSLLLASKDAQLAEDLRNKDLKIGEAQREAGGANERAGQANESAKKLEQENLLLQAEVFTLRKQTEPRRLAGSQRDKLTELLKRHIDGVAVVSAMADPESNDFADDLDTALHDAQWETLRIRNRISSAYGVSVGVVPGGVARPGAKILRDALTAIGIPCEPFTFKNGDASTSPAFQAGYIYLVIEHKPQPMISKETPSK
jgi:hypothetical protein